MEMTGGPQHYHGTEPFDYWVIDNFFPIDFARDLSADFIAFDHPDWFVYDNPLEVKKTLNNWWNFPPLTYSTIEQFNTQQFVNYLENLTGIVGLQPDPGLHGAGWHIHGSGGKLNVHLDYSLHPKLELQRKLNMIYYATEDWDARWGGNLEFWSGDSNTADRCVTTIDCKFNRAVIFDTTQNSWHGFPTAINCPDNMYRKSIAMYYLIEPNETVDPQRLRAKYVPSTDQRNDPYIDQLIQQRAKI